MVCLDVYYLRAKMENKEMTSIREIDWHEYLLSLPIVDWPYRGVVVKVGTMRGETVWVRKDT